MKKLILLLLVLHSSLFTLTAQSWQWVKAEVNDSTGECDPLAITADSSGNIYQTGIYLGSNTFGPYTITSTNVYSGDVFLVKYNNSGSVVWVVTTKSSGGSGLGNVGFSTVTDKALNIYVTGAFTDTVWFGTQKIVTSQFSNSAFLAKYDKNGNLLWVQNASINSSASKALGYSVAVDGLGNAYMTGCYYDTVSMGSYVLKSQGANTFLAKYDPNGNVVWVISGTQNPANTISQEYSAVTTDNANNVYVCGLFAATISFGALTGNALNDDVYLVKFDPNGNPIWMRDATLPANTDYITDVNFFSGFGLGVGPLNSIYLSGTYMGTVQFGTYTLQDGKYNDDIFVVKYNTAGTVINATTSTNPKNRFEGYIVNSLSVNKYNEVYITGTINDSVSYDTVTLNPVAPFPPAFLFKLDSNCNALCGTAVSTVNDDNTSVVADPLGDNVYLGGDVGGFPYCVFGQDTIHGISNTEYGFLSKWSCITCNLTPIVSGASSICEGSSTQLGASGGTAYSWQPTTGLNYSGIPNPIASPSVTTTYTVTVTNGPCSATKTVTVNVHPGPVTDVCCDTTISYGQSATLNASGGITYQWLPAYGLSCDNCPNPTATPNQTTTYTVSMATDSGCSVTEFITIDVNCGQVFIPTAFSPNNDGENDRLYVRGKCITQMDFVVFDRWGNKVFESESLNTGWDGTYKGQPMNTGTYVWYLKATLADGTTLDKKGNVELVR